MNSAVSDRLAAAYPDLSPQLRQAGNHLVAHPIDVLTRSLRQVAGDARVSPATLSRLARILGFSDYAALRDAMREDLRRSVTPHFTARAETLRSGHTGRSSDFLARHAEASRANITALVSALDGDRLDRVAERLSRARKTVLIGGLGSSGAMDYMGYMVSFLGDTWRVAGRAGMSYASELAELTEEDAVLVLTKVPSARNSVHAARIAADRGAFTAVVTDSHTCPALAFASDSFLLPCEGPGFFTSYVPSIFFLEALMAALVRIAGPEALDRIAEVERINRALNDVVDPSG
ncbi:MurR/RpiR family transcriptional regulator [Celeribacter sp.]|uniref:MurR/RpiR family transcriptional regulator n=1 Tax=Celeribacter sp. TaxID=1890673 RepID=UPI003A8D76A7